MLDGPQRGSPENLRSAGRLVSLPDDQSYFIGASPLTIGRGPESDVPVHSEDVSRNHAYLLRTPQGFLLVDSSLHGSYVNGLRVQAQRLLVDGDVIQIGARSFRFDLRTMDHPSARSQAPARDLPETSQYARTLPRDATATGKVGLALALAEGSTWKESIRRWLRRYGPSELAGIATALAGSWLLGTATESSIAAAYGGSFGEAVGFYGFLIIREMVSEAYFAGARRAPYGISEMMRTWRNLFIEFGPAELLDAGVVRPAAMGICTAVLGWGPGILAGKLIADISFYVPVIWLHERGRRKTG
ncbi:MAG TPA: FHA domain-containing protein [Gemmatimonadales bacterium]